MSEYSSSEEDCIASRGNTRCEAENCPCNEGTYSESEVEQFKVIDNDDDGCSTYRCEIAIEDGDEEISSCTHCKRYCLGKGLRIGEGFLLCVSCTTNKTSDLPSFFLSQASQLGAWFHTKVLPTTDEDQNDPSSHYISVDTVKKRIIWRAPNSVYTVLDGYQESLIVISDLIASDPSKYAALAAALTRDFIEFKNAQSPPADGLREDAKRVIRAQLLENTDQIADLITQHKKRRTLRQLTEIKDPSAFVAWLSSAQ